jgi:hypothetical protein
MLFKLLKWFGLDIPAKVAAAKSALEQRAEEVADYAKEATQTAAAIAVLSVFAGISGAMALGVGLLEVYRVVAESFGVNTALGAPAPVALTSGPACWVSLHRESNQSLHREFLPGKRLPREETGAAFLATPTVSRLQRPCCPAFAAAKPRKVKDFSDSARKPELRGTAWWGW